MALLPVSCKNGTKFVRSSYEICTNFVRISYECASKIGTMNVVVTNFVRISYELRTKFKQLARICVIFVFVWVCVVGGVVVCVGMGAWCVRAWVICACIGGSWVLGRFC